MNKVFFVINLILINISICAMNSNIKLGSQLLDAVKQEKIDTVKLLLSKRASTELKDSEGDTPLIWSCRKGSMSITQELLKANAHVNAKNNFGATALYCATLENHTGILKLLLEKGAQIDGKIGADINKATPLHFGSYYGHKDAVQILLAHKAKTDAKNNCFITPLYLAASAGQTEIINLLIAAGAKINEVDQVKETPLIIAACKGHVSAVELLIKHKANINVSNNKGYTALHWAADKGHGDVLKVLINAKADIATKQEDGLTPLHVAENKEVVAILVQAKINPNIRNRMGLRPIDQACIAGNSDVVAELLKHGAQPAASTSSAPAPLHVSSCFGYTSIIDHLLQAGADKESKGKKNNLTALEIAIKSKNPKTIIQLLQQGCKLSESQLESLDILFKAGQKHKNLIKATILGELKLLNSTLARKTATKQAVTQDINGNNALIWSVMRGNEDVVKALLDYNEKHALYISGLTTNIDGQTALSLASKQGKSAIAKLIARHLIPVKKAIKEYLTLAGIDKSKGKQNIAALVTHYLYGANFTQCYSCLEKNAHLKCQRCLNAYYCSSQCQKTDWKKHKIECTKKLDIDC